MGLSDSLARYAVRNARVLLVEAPGQWLTRAAVERSLLARGWRLALSPAEADVLVVCGTAGPELADKVERTWGQMPGPRARVDVERPEDAGDALARAEQSLLDTAQQRDDSRSRALVAPEIESGEDEQGEHEHGEHEHGEHGEHEHGDHEDMDHGGGHEGMDHGGMDMSPAGIPLAEGGEDRDGLEMDVLHLHLGPVLPYWPSGLVLRCSLQGDVVVDAEVVHVDADHGHEPGGRHHEPHVSAALRCDNAVSLLALAGWDDAAARARRVRDVLLMERDPAAASALLEELRRKVRRSWSLRWSLRRLAPLNDEDLARHGLPARLRGDTHDRLLAMLDRAAHAVGGPAGEDGTADDPESVPPDAIPRLVTGLDLATARLVVASLDLDPVPATSEVARG